MAWLHQRELGWLWDKLRLFYERLAREDEGGLEDGGEVAVLHQVVVGEGLVDLLRRWVWEEWVEVYHHRNNNTVATTTGDDDTFSYDLAGIHFCVAIADVVLAHYSDQPIRVFKKSKYNPIGKKISTWPVHLQNFTVTIEWTPSTCYADVKHWLLLGGVSFEF